MKHKFIISRNLTAIIILTWFGIHSCKKDAVPGTLPADRLFPEIFSYKPMNGVAGDTIIINGKNLTGTDIVSVGQIECPYFKVTDPQTITAVLGNIPPAGNLEIFVRTNTGSKKVCCFSGGFALIDGYGYSYEIAENYQVAYWNFDVIPDDGWGDPGKSAAAETFSRLDPVKTVGAHYEPGLAGNALSLTNGYMVFPSIPNLNMDQALVSYTLSLWVKMPSTGSMMNSLFQISDTNSSDFFGQIQVGWNNQIFFGGDTIGVDTRLAQYDPVSGFLADDFFLNPRTDGSQYIKASNNWVHVVVRYNNQNHQLDIFGDGRLLGNKTIQVISGSDNLQLKTPAQVLLGTFAYSDDGFVNSVAASSQPGAAHGITASLDEIRLYNTALSNHDILALTHLGQAGR